MGISITSEENVTSGIIYYILLDVFAGNAACEKLVFFEYK